MMKKMLTENIWLKLVSVLIAAILWVLILYTYDPTATADFTLNVDVINGETITSLGKVYEVMEGNTVTIRVKANSSLVKTLTASDFMAIADISKLSPTYHANIDVVCIKSNNIDIRFIGKVKFLQVKLEDLVTKQFPVTVIKKGEPKEGYFLGTATPKPNFISVSGGESSINRIKTVRVTVDAKGVSEFFRTEDVPRAYDADGNEVNTGSLSFSSNMIAVEQSIFKTKEIPVIVKAAGQPYVGYMVEDFTYEPRSVSVAGDDEKLAKLTNVVLTVDIEGEIVDVERSLRLFDHIPDGIYMIEPDTVVNVNCKIVRMSSKEIEIPTEKIKAENIEEGVTYEFLDGDGIKLVMKGLKKDLDQVTTEVLSPYIDFSGITKSGEYSLEVKCKEIKNIAYARSSYARVFVRVNDEETPNEEEPENEEGGENEPPEENDGENEEGETENKVE